MLRRPVTADFSLRRLPWKRTLQSLLSPEQIQIAIQRESARVDRSGGEFALVIFKLPRRDLDPRATVRLSKTILKRVRATDDIGYFDEENLAVLLPETSAVGAWRFADAVCQMVQPRMQRPLTAVYVYPKFTGKAIVPSNGKHAENGNGVAHAEAPTRVHDLSPAPREHGKSDKDAMLSYMLDGVKSGGEVSPANVHQLESLLARPLPIWKRILDIFVSLTAILSLSWLFAIAAVLVKLSSKGPVIFKQQRAGLGGRPFTIYKLRTMGVDAEAKKSDLMKHNEQDGPAFKITHDPRVTKIGKILRKTSIDELPQLFNVLKGDMTLVGPRPLPMKESDACTGWHRRRLDVTPGLTCIWQVKGRSQVSFSEWVRMDVTYIRRRSLLNDIRIMLQTIPAVLLRRGAR